MGVPGRIELFAIMPALEIWLNHPAFCTEFTPLPFYSLQLAVGQTTNATFSVSGHLPLPCSPPSSSSFVFFTMMPCCFNENMASGYNDLLACPETLGFYACLFHMLFCWDSEPVCCFPNASGTVVCLCFTHNSSRGGEEGRGMAEQNLPAHFLSTAAEQSWDPEQRRPPCTYTHRGNSDPPWPWGMPPVPLFRISIFFCLARFIYSLIEQIYGCRIFI